MTRGIIKYMATLAITAVCGGCHNVSIEMDIDEKGTHVEAVTSTSFATKGEILNPNKAVFYANRPFIYFIRDGFGSICFAGVYHGGK